MIVILYIFQIIFQIIWNIEEKLLFPCTWPSTSISKRLGPKNIIQNIKEKGKTIDTNIDAWEKQYEN